MKKKVYVALLSLCCPIMLNTQQVFAEEAGAENAPTSETVASEDQLSENGPEELPADPAPEVSEEAPEITEETEGSTEEAEDALTEETGQSEETVESTEGSEETVEAVDAASARAIVSVTINYVTADGTSVSSVVKSGEEGTDFLENVPAGYVANDVSDLNSYVVFYNGAACLAGVYSSAVSTITVVVEASNPSGDAQINFVDEAGNPMIGAPSVMLGGEVGDVVSYDPPVIPGYTYSGGTVSVTLTDVLQTIDVVYTRIETTLTVTYLDEAGNQLIADETYTGKFGEVYAFTPASFSGLELISLNGAPFSSADLPITVEMGETDQHMVLVYGVPAVEVPGSPGQPSQVQPVNTVVEVRPEVKPVYDKKTLPETGEKENMVVAAAGMILVAQAAYILKKKKENEFGL